MTSNTPIACVAYSLSKNLDDSQNSFVYGSIVSIQDDKVSENRTQRFREVPGKLEAALSHFATTDCDLVIHLGDIIQSESDDIEQTLQELELIEGIFSSSLVCIILLCLT